MPPQALTPDESGSEVSERRRYCFSSDPSVCGASL